jgi:hypothetical protein
MTLTREQDEASSRRTGLYRLLIGAVQGLAIYLLSKTSHVDNIWLAGAFCAALLAPAVALAEVSRMRVRWLAAWFAVAAVTLGLLGAWAAWREPLRPAYETGMIYRLGLALPAGAVLLFVAHHLVSAGVLARRWIAPYPDYFDAAWRHALQVALSGVFLGIFWALFGLGAFLFWLIGQDFLRKLISHDWFWIPVSSLVFAGAVHLTDVRLDLIRGFRTVVLTLFAVLLPLVAGLSALFLGVGAATGMKGIWTAQAAAAALLAMALAMIVFLNAAYQDGAEERRPAVALRWTMRIAPFLIVALSLLTANTVLVLVLRHGWTPERIVATAAALVVFAHGAGYAWAVIRKGRFMAAIEPTNILAAHLTLVLGLVLLSPIGDPARLSVDSQMARLASGKVAPDKFDFEFLARRSARFGEDALTALAKSTNLQIAERAKRATLFATARPVQFTAAGRAQLAAELPAHIQLYPAGAVLPARFAASILEQHGAFGWDPSCLQAIGQCVGYLIDLDHDGKPELLLWQDTEGAVYKETSEGRWTWMGTLQPYCEGVTEAIRAGLVSAKPPPVDEIDIGGAHLHVDAPLTTCKTTAAAQKAAAQAKPTTGPKVTSSRLYLSVEPAAPAKP